MVTLKINNKEIQVKENTTILKAARENGIYIPTLCYLEGVNEIAACRVCICEVEGLEKLVPSCNTVVEDGMVIYTNSPRVRAARRTNVELLLSQHDCHCPTCARSGNCELQKVANDLDILSLDYETEVPENEWNMNAPLIRLDSKCIKCMRCVQVCDKIQAIGVWDLKGTGTRAHVGIRTGKDIYDAKCSFCGQCITHCPTGALTARDDTMKVFNAIADPEKVTVVQIAPAVRAAWGEYLGLTREEATVEKIAAALKQMGVDYVFDTNFSADLTIMEEGSEFIERFTHKSEYKWPMFTSCCPGWVRFVKGHYPEFTDNLSTAKSPQQMFGAVSKTYFAEKMGIDPHKICNISIMPCSSKKSECALPTMNDACGDQDVDIVLTTRELVRMIKAEHIDIKNIKEVELDSPLGTGTGAAVIFGATGGVMIAALRSAYKLITGSNPDPEAFNAVKGIKPWKEAVLTIPGAGEVKIAVASGLSNAKAVLEAIKAKEVDYDFVEIMACPGGCAGGGGQPIHEAMELADVRGERLWDLDRKSDIRFSHENPEIQVLYKEYLEKPLSEKAEHLLHTDHNAWNIPENK